VPFEQLALPITGLLHQPEPTRIPRTRRVFVNRNLKMAGIDWVGFDMDYTLAIYNQAEMDKLFACDALIFQFPMWWFGMPAILKGWFDRIWHQGYAYGKRGPHGEWIGYGDGFLAGKRALAVVTMGGPTWLYGERGIHGSIDELLFPLQHGMLFYAGAEVLPPVLMSGADRFTLAEGDTAAKELRERLLAIPTAEPIPYRTRSSGDYDEKLVLRPDVAPGLTGLGVHLT